MIPSSLREDFPCKYEGSPGSMESSGMMWTMKRLHIVVLSGVYYEYSVSGDDTSMMKHLTHPEPRLTQKKNICGYLPK